MSRNSITRSVKKKFEHEWTRMRSMTSGQVDDRRPKSDGNDPVQRVAKKIRVFRDKKFQSFRCIKKE